MGTAATYTYDGGGRLVAETGRPGVDRSYRYDEFGRLVSSCANGRAAVTYRYDSNGNLQVEEFLSIPLCLQRYRFL